MLFFYYHDSDSDEAVGWIPLNAPRKAFKAGIIFNGQPPAKYEISLIEPKPDPSLVAKPGEELRALVRVRILDEKSENHDIPPTFVFLIVRHATKHYNTLNLMHEHAKKNHDYFYSCQLTTPARTGIYELTAEVEYAMYDVKDGKQVALEPHRTTMKGVKLNVKK